MTYNADRAEISRMSDFATYTRSQLHVITNALRVLAERHEAAARTAHQAHVAGREDDAVRSEQDASMVTNRGYGVMTQLFRENAEQARQVAAGLEDRLAAWEGNDLG